jgi:hypothetical protein
MELYITRIIQETREVAGESKVVFVIKSLWVKAIEFGVTNIITFIHQQA